MTTSKFVSRALVAGTMALSCSLMVACGGVPISAPGKLAVADGVVSWSGQPENATQLRIERKVGSGRFELIATLPTDATQYRDETAKTSGTTYTYRLLAMLETDHWGGTYSQQASFTAQ